ncbi:uncharacterized protein LOC8261187 [Ricinus communis]|uniref:Uncharacterized protein n=1 Tax=Ricinus communis TaxID=3988 RepID=B9RSL5_RICCO|nr:uncharacterized protein LOC8261187 [Ricinus communis]EEF45632.1 conserved hypothetical protein [Ricinus communis]|eukprot:XP_002516734.1 uncharacterized protein LOC8261187 [Ricinus communis]
MVDRGGGINCLENASFDCRIACDTEHLLGDKTRRRRLMSKEGEEEVKGEDERREAAISYTPYLQPGLKHSRISQDQLFKLQELHKRRLKIKSKIHNNLEDKNCRSHGKHLKHSDGKDPGRSIEGSTVTNLKNQHDSTNVSSQQDNVAADHAPKKRQKLYWGLDTKERWERKANM